MAQNDPLSINSNRKNTLIHEVALNDDFDFLEQVKGWVFKFYIAEFNLGYFLIKIDKKGQRRHQFFV